ncbi:MAG: FAD-binding oxidoreductase [Thermoplasmata archaeon]|jgi:alkyldihydroxyacetonephosphate synthase|nr:FAD-binding oxidoreductase [Candidatus Sysuiplasma jiujiangense]MBX8642059.1 FAD-binding oxidoreductase [Candidatus Sysuiplasma jiujiangense]
MGRVNVLYGGGRGYRVAADAARMLEELTGTSWNTAVWDGMTDVNDKPPDPRLKKLLETEMPGIEVSYSAEVRLMHSVGKSSIELLGLKNGKIPKIVDAVVFPDSGNAGRLLEAARRNGIGIVIYGGGTSVTGGLRFGGEGYVLSLDTGRMKKMELRRNYAVLGAGLTGAEIEHELNRHGFTAGHFPESLDFSTVGGWVATKSSGQESNEYGDIENLLLSVKLHRSDGVYQDRISPRESAGVMAKDIAAGSEGRFGVITEVSMKVFPLPERRHFAAYVFRTFREGVESLSKMKTIPAVARLSDELETKFGFAGSSGSLGKSLLMRYLKMRRAENGALLVMVSNRPLEERPADSVWVGPVPSRMWYRERYVRPYIANELWKRGIVTDTLETSACWEDIPVIYAAASEWFSDAIGERGFRGAMMCHLSHIYTTGGCLYFTIIMKSGNEEEDLLAVRNGLIRCFMENGGSITHHHGLGSFLSGYLDEGKKRLAGTLADPVLSAGR